MVFYYILELQVPWSANNERNSFVQVARIILFMYLFYQIFLHYDQVHGNSSGFNVHDGYQTHISDLILVRIQIKQMETFGYLLVCVVPAILFVMNMIWFSKILRGLKKTLAKRH